MKDCESLAVLERLVEYLGKIQTRVILNPDGQFISVGFQLIGIKTVVVQVLTPVAVRAEVVFVKLLAEFGAVVEVYVNFASQFMNAMSE